MTSTRSFGVLAFGDGGFGGLAATPTTPRKKHRRGYSELLLGQVTRSIERPGDPRRSKSR